jgi:hypothetical protein
MPSKKTLDNAINKTIDTARGKAVVLIHEAKIAKAQQIQVRKKQRLVKPQIKQMNLGVRKSFTIWYKSFMKGFKKLRPLFQESLVIEAPAPNDLDAILDEAFEASDPSMTKALMVGIESTIVIAGTNVLASLALGGVYDVAVEPAVIAYIAEKAAELVVQINETTKKEMKLLLIRAANEGWSYQRTAQEIESRVERWGIIGPPLRPALRELQTRAQLIAVTEIGNAYEAGSAFMADGLAANGFVLNKRWLTAGDKRVDPHCKANAREGWIPYGQAHDSGAMHPLDHPSCRCTELYKVVL